MATASAEGMAGGEETRLHEVLSAKESLELPCVLSAYQIVAQDLRARALAETDDETRTMIENASSRCFSAWRQRAGVVLGFSRAPFVALTVCDLR